MEKFKIEKELVDSFVGVITSNDDEGIKMTMDILSNRDEKDKESEGNFMEIMNKIVRDEVLFPQTEVWIVKVHTHWPRIQCAASVGSRLPPIRRRTGTQTAAGCKGWSHSIFLTWRARRPGRAAGAGAGRPPTERVADRP